MKLYRYEMIRVMLPSPYTQYGGANPYAVLDAFLVAGFTPFAVMHSGVEATLLLRRRRWFWQSRKAFKAP